MKALTVYLNNEKVGTLEQEGSGLLRFSYESSWLTDPNAFPISRSLPLREQPFESGKPRPFFAGILPEEGPRIKIAEFLGISYTNDFSLLERIGGECAGAISLLSGTLEPAEIQNPEIRPLSDSELLHILKLLPVRPLLVGENGMRLSLAGAQNKLPVIVCDNKIHLPVGNTPTTHILKTEPERKYQSEGGPTIKNCVDLIRNWSTMPVLDIPEFINGLIFNVLIGNADAHAKNFSFVYSNTERRLAPYYDLVSTIAWKNLSKNSAMNVGGCKSISVFNIGDWEKMAVKVGVSWPITRERIRLLTEKVLDAPGNVLEVTNEYDDSTLQRLYSEINDRAEKLRKVVI